MFEIIACGKQITFSTNPRIRIIVAQIQEINRSLAVNLDEEKCHCFWFPVKAIIPFQKPIGDFGQGNKIVWTGPYQMGANCSPKFPLLVVGDNGTELVFFSPLSLVFSNVVDPQSQISIF